MAPTVVPKVVIIGLGHAGAEAALAVQRLGGSAIAVTQVPERACLMSCNPAIGGPGKSQLVREIDALGGAMAVAADRAAIQARILNRSKGAASWATRLQVDRLRYAKAMQAQLAEAGISPVRGEVEALETAGNRIVAVRLLDGSRIACGAVILTTGTFLAAKMHVGRAQSVGGRVGDRASTQLSTSLHALGLKLGRFKTGTPPRLEGRTIDWAQCEEQPSEADAGPLSRRTHAFPQLPQRSTFATTTNAATHDEVRRSLEWSPLTSGAITAKGPRYCPSLEQKVLHYPDRVGHAIYLEPDGLDTSEVYPAGLSTSLPENAQLALLRTIRGLSRVELRRPGYAVEYDYLAPNQLTPWLEHRELQGLFFAGQINGSSGYEEAAAQGLVAGTNAARRLARLDPWIPSREDSFIGVLCDDLVRQGFDEPYRVLPSRAEHRIRLREDNAAHRLTAQGRTLGLVTEAAAAEVRAEQREAQALLAALSDRERRALVSPALEEAEAIGSVWPKASFPAARLALRDLRYAPYLKQREVAGHRLGARAEQPLPADLDYGAIPGLSTESRETLQRSRPETLGEAARLPGMTDAAVAVMAAHLNRRARLLDVSRGTDR